MDFGIGFLYQLAKDIFGKIKRNKRSLTQIDRVDCRVRWEAEFKPRLMKRSRDGLNSDVIIRDVGRVDDYPESNDGSGFLMWLRKKRISSWFRAGLLATLSSGNPAGSGMGPFDPGRNRCMALSGERPKGDNNCYSDRIRSLRKHQMGSMGW